MTRFLDRFRVVLLDMGHTFLFDCDRFGPGQDYLPAYRDNGGIQLDGKRVTTAIEALLASMLADYRDPACYDDYKSVAEHLSTLDATRCLPPPERRALEGTFAAHERGRISEQHAAALHSLRATHPLGLISNIWSPPAYFVITLGEAGVYHLFDHIVWSSEHRCIKPSPRIFRLALDAFGVAPEEAVYVGDDPKRDIAPAKALGMGAVWIRNDLRPLPDDAPQPDLVIDHLAELPDCPS